MTLEQTRGWGWEPVLHPDDLQTCVAAWSEAVRTGNDYDKGLGHYKPRVHLIDEVELSALRRQGLAITTPHEHVVTEASIGSSGCDPVN